MDAGLFGKADPYVRMFAITNLTSSPDGEHGWLGRWMVTVWLVAWDSWLFDWHAG